MVVLITVSELRSGMNKGGLAEATYIIMENHAHLSKEATHSIQAPLEEIMYLECNNRLDEMTFLKNENTSFL